MLFFFGLRKRTEINKSLIKYLISLLLFGLNGIVASNISLDSYEIVLTRTFFGSALLILILAFSKEKTELFKNKKDLIYIVISGMAMGASWMFLYEAFSQVGVSIAVVLYYAGPAFVMILSPFLFKEKFTLTTVLGFISVVFGVALINRTVVINGSFFGIFCAMMSAVTYCVMVCANKKSSIKGVKNSAVQLVVSFVFVLDFVTVKTGMNIHIAKCDWKWILLLGLVNTGLGCYFYFSTIGDLSIQTVAVCSYIEPLSAVIFSAVFLKERLSVFQILGSILIVGGAIFAELFKIKKSRNR